jgi:NAD(P)-dependent dehydrogenase (short-subunit alcohol dehydrogenase family)
VTSAGKPRAACLCHIGREGVQQVVEQAERDMRSVTLLVNNAGTPGPVGPDWEVDTADWWRCIEVSVCGAFLCTQAVLPRMLPRGQDRIINVVSLTGVRPCPFWTGTSIAKTALIRFAEGLAAETQGRGIGVFAIRPGAERTVLVTSYFAAPDSARWVPALHQAPGHFPPSASPTGRSEAVAPESP